MRSNNPFWLARAAANRLRSRHRRPPTEELREDRAGVASAPEELDTERGLEWGSRIALVLTFFQPKVRCRVKAMVSTYTSHSIAHPSEMIRRFIS
jgi:hypothetical protein